MPGQARKFTDEQRNAIVRAVLVDGMTQVDAVKAANAGELVEGQPFTIARGTLQGYLKRAIGDPSEGIKPDQVRAQLLSALKREIDAELPKLEGRRKLDFITQALHAVNAAKWEPGQGRPKKAKGEPKPEAEERSESLERLTAAHEAENGTAPTDVPLIGNAPRKAQPLVANGTEADSEQAKAEGQGLSEASEIDSSPRVLAEQLEQD